MAIKDLKQFIQVMSEDLNKYKEIDDFRNLTNSIASSGANVNLREHFLQQQIDLSWIEAIEKTIIPMDNILRDPRRFIKNEEDIVPIALARGITTDSIKHLAQHTNMIQSVKNGVVTPEKILEVRKEESFETYENRFLLTLLKKISFFLDKRMNIINDNVRGDNQYEVTYAGQFAFEQDRVNYSISFNYESQNRLDEKDLIDLINQDVRGLNAIQRIERLRKILYDFQNSQFVKNMGAAPLIKPPLTMTNLLKKHPDYQACVELWMTLESYTGSGVALNVIDRDETPGDEMIERLMQFTALQYLYLKDYSGGLEAGHKPSKMQVHKVEKTIEEVVNSYDFEIDEIKRIFLDKVAKREKKQAAIEKRYIAIMREALKDESDWSFKNDPKVQKDKLSAHISRRKSELIQNVQKHRKIELKKGKEEKNTKNKKQTPKSQPKKDVKSKGKKVTTNEGK